MITRSILGDVSAQLGIKRSFVTVRQCNTGYVLTTARGEWAFSSVAEVKTAASEAITRLVCERIELSDAALSEIDA